MRIDCYKAQEWHWVDSQFTFYCRQTWHSPQETGASPKQALPSLFNFSTGQKSEKRQKRAMTNFPLSWLELYELSFEGFKTRDSRRWDWRLYNWNYTLLRQKKETVLVLKASFFVHRYQCAMCTLFSIFFRATVQAETYLKIGVLVSHWTYICPSLFECAENTFFHIFVIFKL